MRTFQRGITFLKDGALIIREDRACKDPGFEEEFEPEEMRRMSQLRELSLPYIDGWNFLKLLVFEKVPTERINIKT